MSARFTVDGSEALEQQLESACAGIAAEVRGMVGRHFDGLLLGGGYGRGEGGVLKTPEGDRPYNDLEFYLFVRGSRLFVERKYRKVLHECAERHTRKLGLEVEFKVVTRRQIQSCPASMFYYDLVMGHRRIAGEETLLEGCGHHAHAERIPLHEAARLLLNRCSGLLFAKEQIERSTFGPEEADFAGRNLAKLQLALGDAVLTAYGLYHWSVCKRHQRLEKFDGLQLPWIEDVRREHGAGAEFKLHPRKSANERDWMAQRHFKLSALAMPVWLWLESRRLSQTFVSPRDYALSTVNKCPETGPWRNRAVQFKSFGLGALRRNDWSRYPRERLFHSLPLLLWAPDLNAPEVKARLKQALGGERDSLPGWISLYADLWKRFN